MATLYYYLLKVLLYSGLLYMYYFATLRNKKLHRYNRFYLLMAVLLPWVLPLLKISIDRPLFQQPSVVKILTVVNGGGPFSEPVMESKRAGWDWNIIFIVTLLFISALFLTRLLLSLTKMVLLIRRSRKEKTGDLYLVYSDVTEAPFSFFHYIFWNDKIDLESPEGATILRHEVTHARERHSLDRIFVSLSIVFGWYNPFAWLIQRELQMIHEFLADEKSVPDGDLSIFAGMLLTSSYPGVKPSELVLSFFQSPVKRRVRMLGACSVGKARVRRLGIGPLLAITTFLSAYNIQENSVDDLLAGDRTVILDAGHGGYEAGVVSGVLEEKNFNLRIAQRVRALNKDSRLKILLTREEDQRLSPQDRVKYAKEHPADAFVSIHTNSPDSAKEGGGAEICITHGENRYFRDSKLLAGYMALKLQGVFKGNVPVVQKRDGIAVLDHNGYCPAILVECGSLPGEPIPADAGREREDIIARRILAAIEQYLAAEK